MLNKNYKNWGVFIEKKGWKWTKIKWRGGSQTIIWPFGFWELENLGDGGTAPNGCKTVNLKN